MPIRKDIPQGMGESYKMGHEIARSHEEKKGDKLDYEKAIKEDRQNPEFKTRIAIEALHQTLEGGSVEVVAKAHGLQVKEVLSLRDAAYKYLIDPKNRFFVIEKGQMKDRDANVMLRMMAELYVSGNTKEIAEKYNISRSSLHPSTSKLVGHLKKLFSNERRPKTPQKS